MPRFTRLAAAAAAAGALASPSLAAQTCPVSLTTIYASNNGGSVGGAVYFDLVVASPVSIRAFAVNTTVALGNPIGLSVYTNATVPTYAGNETDPNWARAAVDDGSAVAAGADSPSRCQLAAPLFLLPGTYPMALVGTGAGGSFNHRYTNGNGANQDYGDSNLSIRTGSASNVPFVATVFTPRVWNGTIDYRVLDVLSADFAATFVDCTVPVTASFADLSCSTDPGGITSWSWSFGDGAGSSLANPTHTYVEPGLYTVSLTVTDAAHAPATRVRRGLVRVAWPNDECSEAIEVFPGRQGPFGNSCASDSLPAMVCGSNQPPGDNDVWFRYRHLGPSATVAAGTCGSFTDTKLEVLAGSCGALAAIGCNDDRCGLQSRVTWQATTNTTYYVRIGGYGGARGAFDLQIEILGTLRVLGPGCAGTALQVRSSGRLGLPQIGSDLAMTLTAPAAGTAQVIWIGQALPAPAPPCNGCQQRCGMTLACIPGASCTATIPNDPGLCGATLCVQGAVVHQPPGPGCSLGALSFTVSEAIEVLVGC